MTAEELKNATDEELQKEIKRVKSSKIFAAAIIGFSIGIAIYSLVKNGFGLLILLPLLFFPIGRKATLDYRAVQEELNSRKARIKNLI